MDLNTGAFRTDRVSKPNDRDVEIMLAPTQIKVKLLFSILCYILAVVADYD